MINLEKKSSYRYPSNYKINKYLDLLGYNYYLPNNILKYLINYCSHKVYDEGYSIDIKRSYSPFDIKLLEFLNSLNLDIYNGISPLEKAIFILKEMSSQFSLRKLENGNKDFKEKEENYLVDISDEKELYEDIDEDDIAELIKISVNFCSDIITSESKTKRSKLNKISDVVKLRKSEFAKPDFMYKVATKNLILKDVDKLENPQEVIILEDYSGSMISNKGLVKAVQRLVYNDEQVVHYYRYTNEVLSYDKITTKSEKLKVFLKENDGLNKCRCNYYELFDEISEKHKNGVGIIVTDSQDSVPLKIDTNVVFNCVTREHSKYMSNLIKKTGGKYLVV